MKKAELKELIKSSLLEDDYLEDDPKAVEAYKNALRNNPKDAENAEEMDAIAEADAIVEAWTSKSSLTENKQAGIQELKRILDDAAALGDEARQIFEMYFPNELRRAAAYDVFSFGSSSNSFDTTLASIIDEIEEGGYDDDEE